MPRGTRINLHAELSTPEDGAVYWFAREQSGLLTRPEREARDSWLDANLANRKAFERASALWSGLTHLAAHEEMRKLRREALDAKPLVRAAGARTWMAAAGLSAATIGGYLWLSQYPFAPGGPNEAHHRTVVGERSTVTLKDGSVITLNTASELTARFTKATRTVELKRGQAYFSVAQDKHRPFVVIAGGRRITALGTAFDVRLYRDQVQVVLVEGRIAVNPLGASANRIELDPGERFLAKDETTGHVSNTNVETSTSWRSGRIVFSGTSIAEAVAEVNLYREMPIVIGDAPIGALKISGTYRVSQADSFPQALAAYYPLQLAVRPSGETILLWAQHATN